MSLSSGDEVLKAEYISYDSSLSSYLWFPLEIQELAVKTATFEINSSGPVI